MDKSKLESMKALELNEVLTLNDVNGTLKEVVRVPGGWLYVSSRYHGVAHTFIPISSEEDRNRDLRNCTSC